MLLWIPNFWLKSAINGYVLLGGSVYQQFAAARNQDILILLLSE